MRGLFSTMSFSLIRSAPTTTILRNTRRSTACGRFFRALMISRLPQKPQNKAVGIGGSNATPAGAGPMFS